jgi:hypothetical protein
MEMILAQADPANVALIADLFDNRIQWLSDVAFNSEPTKERDGWQVRFSSSAHRVYLDPTGKGLRNERINQVGIHATMTVFCDQNLRSYGDLAGSGAVCTKEVGAKRLDLTPTLHGQTWLVRSQDRPDTLAIGDAQSRVHQIGETADQRTERHAYWFKDGSFFPHFDFRPRAMPMPNADESGDRLSQQEAP